MPSEILICPPMLDFKDVTTYIKQHTNALVELREDACFKDAVMEQTMADQFGADWRTTLGYEKDALVPYAVAALLNYLHETQKHGVERIKTVQNYADAQYMRLSPVTRANLELTETMRGREKRGTLLWVLDKTETSMGKRLLRSWIEQPLVDADAINARLCAVQALYSASIARADLKEALGHVFDIERLTTRILYGSATPREVKALGDTCAMLPQVKAQAAACGAPLLTQLADQIDLLEDVLQNIQTALVDDPPANMKDGGAIRAGFNSEVDELRDIMHGGKGYLSNLEARYREETGIPKLKIGFNKVFGYYIEVSRSYTDSVPDTFTRKQTLTTGERYITPELKELENKILGANERLLVLEHQLFADLLSSISAEVVRIQRTASAVAQLDVLAGFAEAALQNNYVMPNVDESGVMEIKEGRHPVIEQMLKGSLFVPNDTMLDEDDNRMLLITGPNMAGKSTYMRQNALIALMAQIGSFVPAAAAHIGVVDAIFTRVEVLTRTEADEYACCYRIEGGEERGMEPGARPVGTTITVSDLFYNTPARMKFLKKDASEGTFVAETVLHAALSHPEISFRYLRDGKQQYVTPGDGDLRSAVYAVLGREFARDLLPVDGGSELYHVTGLVTPPRACRASRGAQHFFVNGRYVKNRTMMAALENAYKGTMMQGKFPGAVLMLELPPDMVDVNVHPAKTEIRFAKESDVFDAVYRAVLYSRIDRRVDEMVENGVLDEARQVYDHRDAYRTAAQAIGYKEFFPYFEGTANLTECTERLKQATRNYAKRQLTWFRRQNDAAWLYLDEEDVTERACTLVRAFLHNEE